MVSCHLPLKRQLGVSYKTAWLIKHKLLQTMRIMYRREETRKLDVRVEVDDAYLGGECTVGSKGARAGHACALRRTVLLSGCK